MSFKTCRLQSVYKVGNTIPGAFAPPEPVSDVAFLLERNLSGISLTVLFSFLFADTRASVCTASPLSTYNVEFPCNSLSIDFCVRHVQVCQLPPSVFRACCRAFTRVTCW